MKYLLTIFLVSLALQPPALQSCAMDDAQTGSSHHAAMQDHRNAECCEADSADPSEGCDESAQCAFFSVGFVVIPAAAGIPSTPAKPHYDLLDNNPYTGPPARRLFRPPIA